MSQSLSSANTPQEFYKKMMEQIEQKFYDVPDEKLIQKITPLFNKIKEKRKDIEKIKSLIERTDKLLENKEIPNNIVDLIKSGKNKLIEDVKKLTELLAKIEKEDYAKVVLLTNLFLFEKIKDCDKFDEEVDIPIKELSVVFLDLEYWVRFEEWDYAEQCALTFNREECETSKFHIPSPLELYYNYCRIS